VQHPHRDELEAYVHLRTTKSESSSVIDEHVRQCVECQAEINQITRDGSQTSSGAKGQAPKIQRIGRFEIIEKLGVGGMGTVYKARDPNLNRVVALKVLDSIKASKHPTLVDRFKKEAEIGARFKDRNFVEVFESGEIGEGKYVSYFIVMELVAGKTLQEKLHDMPRGAKRVRYAVRLVEKLAEAMHRFHQKGYVHRDLKPANIFVLYEGGGIKIADFGITAKENERGLTSTGKFLGTPLYMAPEQIDAAPTFGRQTDIYALGTIFYELLVGKPPFAGERDDLFSQIARTLAVPPSEGNSSVPKSLDAICLKCLEKNPKHRYADALTLASDLRKYLNDAEPRPTRWPKVALLTGCVMALLLCAISTPVGALAWLNWRAEQHKNDAVVEVKKRPDPPLQEKPPIEEEDPPTKPPVKAEVPPAKDPAPKPPDAVVPRPDLPIPFKMGNPWDTKAPPLAKVTLLKELIGHTGRVGAVAFSANGKLIVTGSDDKTVRTWELPKGQEREVLKGHTSPITCVAICPDEKLIAAGSSEIGLTRSVKVWKLDGEALQGLKIDENRSLCAISSLAFSRGGDKLAIGTDARVILWNRTTGQSQTLEEFPTTGDYAYAVAFSPRGDTLAAGLHFIKQAAGMDIVKTWTFEPAATTQHELVKDADWQPDSRGAMVYSPDGARLAQVVPTKAFPSAQPGKVYVWTMGKTPRAETFDIPAGGLYAAITTSKGVTRVAAANAIPRTGRGSAAFGVSTPSHHIRVWDSASLQAWTLDTAHQGAVTALAFSPDGDTLATASADGTVRLWDLRTLNKAAK